MKKKWLIILFLVWIIGGLFIYFYWERTENLELSVSNKGYYPANYVSKLKCWTLDNPRYILEKDEIQCEYKLQANNNVSLQPNIKKYYYYENKTNYLKLVEGSEYFNMSFQKAYEMKNENHTFNFKLSPLVEGKYEFRIISDLYSPPAYYQLKESNNITLNLNFQEKANDYTKYEEEYNNTTETEFLQITLKCDDVFKTWFINERATCVASIKNKKDKEYHILNDFKLFKDGQDVTNDKKKIGLDWFEIEKSLSYNTKIETNKEDNRYVWFYPKESGIYTLSLKVDVIDSNLYGLYKDKDDLQLQFKTISRDEYTKKEENRKTILITLFLALFLSTPIALKAIKELIK